MLHLNQKHNINEPVSNTDKGEQTATTSTTTHVANETDNVLLGTAVVEVFGLNGERTYARALLDSGSTNHFICSELVNILRLNKHKTNHIVYGIGNSKQNVTATVSLRIKSRVSDYEINTQLLIVPKITGDLPARRVSKGKVKLERITLADPSYNVPQKIDILIGARHFYDIVGAQQYKPDSNGPVYRESKFGYIISGLTSNDTNIKNTISCYSSNSHENIHENKYESLENVIQQFWRIEDYGQSKPYTREEQTCEQHFKQNVSRSESGRFVVHLPFRGNVSKLGKSYDIAKRRLFAIERRFIKNPSLKGDYVKFMTEYEKLNHMTQNMDNEEIEVPGRMCYLAHHCVQNENSLTTKLRVVFDASTKTESGVSLNDVLQKGPSIQEELIHILARFRTHNFVVTADIKKMYRQIQVCEKHRDYQRILWRENVNDPIKIYRLNTVTYGTVPASYLATACLQRLSEIGQGQYPTVAPLIARDFYMDDFISGAATKKDAIEIRNALIKLMSTAKLELGKWASNDSDIIRDSFGNNDGLVDFQETSNELTRILGLYWDSHTDELKYKINETSVVTPLTKRNILSDIARIYDPLGLIGPVIVCAKLIMQELWTEGLSWSEPVSEKISSEWYKYKSELSHLNAIKIPRQITINDKIHSIQIHGFADASIKAYGCCLYLRCTDMNNKHTVRLIGAKSKVAPLKILSLPRLELCAALLLAKVANKIVPRLRLSISRTYYWTDSSVTWCWITSTSKKWKTFVAHRVGQIQEITSPLNWFHISGVDNPADVISRGCCPTQLASLSVWWNGPSWLSRHENDWPDTMNRSLDCNEESAETKTNAISALCTTASDINIINRYSSFGKLLRVVAYCLRFKTNCSRKINKTGDRCRRIGNLSADEIKLAKTSLIKVVQRDEFANEIKSMLNGEAVSSKSKLFRLRPFLDKNNIICVGGRLKHAASISIFQRNPIVLPSNSNFTKLLLCNEHVTLMHGGPQAILSSLRMCYWPINGRNLARNIVNKCVVCFKQKPIIMQPIMGDLPKHRVSPGRAFLRCGVDFAGPFMVKTSIRRNAPKVKSYVSVFICLATRAIHLELVSDLSTDAFIRALNRFFDRRGKSIVIYSDNATNFVGANRKLKEWYQLFHSDENKKRTMDTLSDLGIDWKFIPSPHFGGLWEAGVKSMKSLLSKVLGESYFTYEELLTIITRAEACLNSRPLTLMSSDPSDMSHLTPGHFLIGDSLSAIPEVDETNVPTSYLSRWRCVSQYSDILWRRWSKEYLSQLQERSKWASERGVKLKEDSIVIMREENLPPMKWRLGRIINVIPGQDGVIRVADVKTANGTFRRAVRQLCPLPFVGNCNL
ncbi:uncharacterized protein LOC114126329 [Aphis gossypii]|uniref:uncharacterized protein LOC114126329 n=1 Tax=Aphis gossypii TaxID=80765 RepID=UPI0021596049|nr:uncharacterized protein LOC114126329 [Aphis gossypii]